jgi:hypothetical protein
MLEALRDELQTKCGDIKAIFRQRRPMTHSVTEPITNEYIRKNTGKEPGQLKRLYKKCVVVIDIETFQPVLVVRFGGIPMDQVLLLVRFFSKMKHHVNAIDKNGAQLHGSYILLYA